MPRFLIQTVHDPDPGRCLKAVEIFLHTGSHYLTHAEWGCVDGVHKAWMIVDAESKEEALRIVPPQFRNETQVVGLNRFTFDEDSKILPVHGAT